MTAATSKEDEEECMRSGFTLYLPKPVKYGAVKDLIERKQQEKQRRANALEARKEEEEEEEENPRSSP
jgi:DNA-binding NtrC family response regulator